MDIPRHDTDAGALGLSEVQKAVDEAQPLGSMIVADPLVVQVVLDALACRG